MRWMIAAGPDDDGDAWIWQLNSPRQTREVRVRKPAENQGRILVEAHLDDHNPPAVLGTVPGWNFEKNQPAEAEMGFVQLVGLHGRWIALVHRLNLPRWLQPRP